jgi:hypothetical protein
MILMSGSEIVRFRCGAAISEVFRINSDAEEVSRRGAKSSRKGAKIRRKDAKKRVQWREQTQSRPVRFGGILLCAFASCLCAFA